ncbi:hypothetical protein [Aliiruegeria lutimaris]|uniref:Uncharacterized protein n=1 Tax=Aliiruegeria lutimaris TaxID=571298 RepID=A0A1G9GBF5_9RHOB|nr:hypothetical protein [Aliiruegeria lutimaris]SDK97996.1 hypothetical protein SAMN04488026_106220 [Aliiruegeria lutimaris]
MTADELFAAVQVPETAEERFALAEELLAEYKGDDKEFITPYLWEMLIVLGIPTQKRDNE